MALELNENQKKALSWYLAILRQKYKNQILKVTLLGSIARGDSYPVSDIDLLVVAANSDQKTAVQWWKNRRKSRKLLSLPVSKVAMSLRRLYSFKSY